MQLFQLRAFDLFCLHIYLILFLQLFFNWNYYSCNINMSIALLFMYLIYVIRVIIVQLKRISLSYDSTQQKQRLLSRHATVPCSIVILNYCKYGTEVILIGMNIFLIVMLVEFKKALDQDVCGSRDIVVLFIVVNFIICIKSVVNVIIQNRAKDKELKRERAGSDEN